MKHVILVACCVIGSAGIAAGPNAGWVATQGTKGGAMDKIAEQYVKLVLALGQHDADYVDAYYGPPEWKKEAAATKIDLDSIGGRARTLIADLDREANRRAAETTPLKDARPRAP